ncbi:CapA family protein [Myxococcus virescens]|uniref:Capsule biosynthesis protein n=1 Tax=Myxococcus virescens TaxID=83456 RepID=A0A511HHE7_9BACT|nr:CapA family protein [Myxococcus virescens]GEL72996.1 capsule biosynthesis protein [Myxococcus virescens]SDE07986.1 poly-gamma-glutamate synthesis protein (capsule biosynthesis protein) [Myxococcus virescens]
MIPDTPDRERSANGSAPSATGKVLTLLLCGDVMTGRGIDQVLPHPAPPGLHEDYLKDARDYVRLAEERNGPIRTPVGFGELWGDALDEMERAAPDVRIINLETSVTTSAAWWPDKGIHYRMHPENAACLTAARIDCCALANNHVLDWGYPGLLETLATLRRLGIATAGLGEDQERARRPAILDVTGGRVAVFSFGDSSSGIPPVWAATEDRPGVDLLPALTPTAVRQLGERVAAVKRTGDIVVASIHWGGNWGYAVPDAQRAFARALIDEAGVDIIHGHSSHHPRGIEVHRGHLILYGCGDFLNDYEGISGHTAFRPDLTLLYLASIAPATGQLAGLRMLPMQLRQLRPHHASRQDAEWLGGVLDQQGRDLGTRTRLASDGNGALVLQWT